MSPLYCYATMTLVEQNGLRPGYDCRCKGCLAYVAIHGMKVS